LIPIEKESFKQLTENGVSISPEICTIPLSLSQLPVSIQVGFVSSKTLRLASARDEEFPVSFNVVVTEGAGSGLVGDGLADGTDDSLVRLCKLDIDALNIHPI
jgi:hypothetical protein